MNVTMSVINKPGADLAVKSKLIEITGFLDVLRWLFQRLDSTFPLQLPPLNQCNQSIYKLKHENRIGSFAKFVYTQVKS